MSEEKPKARAPEDEHNTLFAFVVRHRLKLAAILIGLALALMLVDAALKGSAY